MTLPIDNDQPTIVLNEDVVESGVFAGNSGADPNGLPIGTIRIFADDTPAAEVGVAKDQQPAQGQTLSVTQQQTLFSILGTQFGGNGIQTFGLPNLTGTVMVGTGSNPGTVGTTYGHDSVTLTDANLPLGGAVAPYSNDQPSMEINYLINIGGNFEGPGVNDLGMVVAFTGNYAPTGYALADGQLMSIVNNQALYAIIGNTYGGNASEGTFALPNLEGRAIIGADSATLGTASGSDGTSLTVSNLPFSPGSDQPVSNQQPTLALYYIIDVNAAGSAILPTSGALGDATPYYGEIMAYAGLASSIPTGWVVAAGQQLSIAANQALFVEIGFTYGGNGSSTFDLPDLEGKVVAGTGTSNSGQTYSLGETYGTSSYNLTTSELPPNQAPSVTLGSAVYTTPEQQSLDLGHTGISVADPDGGFGTETLTIQVSEGTLHAMAGVVTVTSGNDTSDLVLSGTSSSLDLFLENAGNLTFIDNTNTPDTVTLTLSLNDNGNTGSGGPLTSALETASIDVVACYCPGTLIKTARTQRKIESLRIGDKVRTASGALRPIKWIGRRSYGGRFIMGRKDILPICFKAGSIDANVPARDLFVSPHHAMYLDDVLIEAMDLVNGVTIVQSDHVERVEYIHIELETHDVIIAEGALSETFVDDDSRGMFHNAEQYRRLYPDAKPKPARYYAPRLSEGFQLEEARRRLAERAGLCPVAERSRSLRGQIDLISRDCITGWAQDQDHPEAPVCLDIYLDGRLIDQVLANRHRDDLEHIGSGCHSFSFVPPHGAELGSIEIRRALDGAVLSKPAGALRAA